MEGRKDLFRKLLHHVECFGLFLPEVRGDNDLVNAQPIIVRQLVDHFGFGADQQVLAQIFFRLGAGQGADDALIDDAGAAKDIVETLVVDMRIATMRRRSASEFTR